MQLAELIDLEAQLGRDEHAGDAAAAVPARDRAIGLQIADEFGIGEGELRERLGGERELRHRVCAAWLQKLPPAARAVLPGQRIVGGIRWAGAGLAVLFALLGAGAATGALSGTGRSPANVLVFIVVFFLAQIVLLALLPLVIAWRQARGSEVAPGLQGLIVRISQWRLLDRLLGHSIREQLAALPAGIGRWRSRQSIYGGVLQAWLFTNVQRMASVFNIAALLTSLALITFRDLTFCWSTTLEIAAAQLHAFCTAIATPWSWLVDGAVPSERAIEASRWIPEPAGFAPTGIPEPEAIALRRTWWPFLIAGLILWGLLPRLAAWFAGSYWTRRRRARVKLDHMAVQHLFDRMYPPVLGWRGPAPDAVRGAAPDTALRARPKAPRRDPGGPCFVVCWGSLADDPEPVRAHVERRFARPCAAALPAGLPDVAVDAQTRAAILAGKARRVVFALPEGQQPTKDILRFLAALRSGLGPECELVVGLLVRDSLAAAPAGGTAPAGANAVFRDVDPDEIDSWRQRLLAEGDPYLTVQSMGLAE